MNELQKIESFQKELALAETFEQIKLLGDAGEAYAEFMKRQGIGKEGINKLGKFLIEVDAKKGEWLSVNYPKSVRANDRQTSVTETETHKMPATPKESARARTLSKTSNELMQSVISELEKSDEFVLPKTVYKKIKEKEKKKAVQESIKNNQSSNDNIDIFTTENKYRIIYADPAWNYGDKLIDGYGAAEHHYPSMTIQQMCDLPIKKITEDNAVLFMWVTSPLLEECFEVIKAWGFKYKSSFVWDKIKHNMGHYNSVRHEFLLICTKGKCTPDKMELFDSVQTIERTKKHSEKPEEFRKIIDTIYLYGKKIELFSRTNIKNWDRWGNQ